MADELQYIACHPLYRTQLAPALRLIDVNWTEVVNGNGTFKAKCPMPTSLTSRELIRQALEPDSAAIYVRAPNGSYPWGGLVVEQEWKKKEGFIEFTAVEWRSWPYYGFLGPKIDLTADLLYSWTNTDQLSIARDIITFVTASGTADGRPTIALGSEVSGKNRDLTVRGLDFKYAGELLETLSQRAGGFEWTIGIYPDNTDGLPRLKLELGFPERGATLTGMLLRQDETGGNMALRNAIKRSSVDRRTRVWTTGNTETLPFAQDSDVGLASGVLLREKVTSHSTVLERTTLAAHARAERAFLSPAVNFLEVTVEEGAFPIWDYKAGDRARTILKDGYYDLDLPSPRILSRSVNPRSGAGTVDLTIDLVDIVPPEVDTGGSV